MSLDTSVDVGALSFDVRDLASRHGLDLAATLARIGAESLVSLLADGRFFFGPIERWLDRIAPFADVVEIPLDEEQLSPWKVRARALSLVWSAPRAAQ